MKRTILLLPLLLSLLAFVYGQGPDGGTVTQATVALLDDPAVRKELKLTAKQDSEVKAEFKRVNEVARQVVSKRPSNEKEAAAARSKIRSLQIGLATRLQAKLTPPQAKRLREIGLQFFGPFSLMSPEIQKELGMNASQIAKVKAAQKSLFDKTRELQSTRQAQVRMIPQPKDRNDQKAVKEYMGKVQALMAKFGPGDGKTIAGYKKAAEAQALNSLSAAQKVKWKAMNGVKFTPPKSKA